MADKKYFTRMGDGSITYMTQAEIRDDIAGGRFVTDQALPSEAVLCARFGVSRTVVREALRELSNQNLVYSVKGKGTFVAPQKPEVSFLGSAAGSADELRHSGRRVTTRILKQEKCEADDRESAFLEIPLGSDVVRLTRLRYVDGPSTPKIEAIHEVEQRYAGKSGAAKKTSGKTAAKKSRSF